MNHESDLELEAASATADGLATPDERALVDSSPTLQHDVETFAAIRALIADVTVPAASRAAAVSAALAVFDESPVQATAAATGSAELTGGASRAGGPLHGGEVVSLDARRRRRSRALLGAAAAVAMLGVGAVVLGGRDAEDEGSSSDAGASVSTVVAAGADPLISGTTGSGVPSAGRSEAPVADDATESAADASVPVDDLAESAPAPGSLEINVPAAVTPAFSTPDELLGFATAADGDSVDPTPPGGSDASAEPTTAAGAASTAPGPVVAGTGVETADPATSCVTSDSEYVGLVRYQGTLAYVVRVVSSGEVRALATIDCALIANVSP